MKMRDKKPCDVPWCVLDAERGFYCRVHAEKRVMPGENADRWAKRVRREEAAAKREAKEKAEQKEQARKQEAQRAERAR